MLHCHWTSGWPPACLVWRGALLDRCTFIHSAATPTRCCQNFTSACTSDFIRMACTLPLGTGRVSRLQPPHPCPRFGSTRGSTMNFTCLIDQLSKGYSRIKKFFFAVQHLCLIFMGPLPTVKTDVKATSFRKSNYLHTTFLFTLSEAAHTRAQMRCDYKTIVTCR